jgi:hypothetical protein
VQLPGGGQLGGLAADVEQPGGQLPQPSAERVAVLIDHRDVAVVVHGHHGHRAEVLDDLSGDELAAGHPDPIAAQRENLSGVQRFG